MGILKAFPAKRLRLFVLFHLVCCVTHLTRAAFVIPGLHTKPFVHLGDVNLGALMPMSSYIVDSQSCSGLLISPSAIHFAQVMEYAVLQVNKKGLLPGNVTMGFVVLDDCKMVSPAVIQALSFVPQTTCPDQGSTIHGENNSVTAYDVIGVIGSTRSSQTEAVSFLLGPAHVPLVSFFSTSDDLSDKTTFPYLLRTVPPDKFQFRAIFTLIKEQGWTYVSVVYEEGSYGENGFKQLRDLFDISGVCLAAVHKVSILLTVDQSDLVARDLASKSDARVVVLIMNSEPAYKVIAAAGRLLPPGTFLWVGSDGWANSVASMTGLGRLLLGSLVISPSSSTVPDYEEYFKRLTPNDTSNPWFPEFWNKSFNCSLAKGSCSPNLTLEGQQLSPRNADQITDTVNMFANATARILNSPDCRLHTRTEARGCLTGPRLLAELKATRQQGYSGWLELDVNGDRLGKYLLRQVLPASDIQSETGITYVQVPVAEYDSLKESMRVIQRISWAYFQLPKVNQTAPESRCSWPCAVGQARVPQEVKCCWFCLPCRVNERLSGNGTRCEACPLYTWPDHDTDRTSCLSIPLDTPQWPSVRGVVQTTVAVGSFLCCAAVFVFFGHKRRCRVIKASSRELSHLMLLAIVLGSVVMVTLLAPPDEFTCRVNFFMFCLSFALLYGPLLVRTLRIYRIFEAGQRSIRRPGMVSSGHQIFFSLGLVFVQALMCAVVMAVYPTWHKLTMKVVTEPYVELSCDMHEVGLASFLVYNLLMVVVCAYLAFKTRRLPDNFNESRFISMCVSTTLVIWLASIPAYMVSGREHLKMLMLALALALNHSVALVFLFLPKVYAVLYLEGAGDVSHLTFQGGPGTMATTTSLRHFGTLGGVLSATERTGNRHKEAIKESVPAMLGVPNFNQVGPAV